MEIKEADCQEDYLKVMNYVRKTNMNLPNSTCILIAYDDDKNIHGIVGIEYVCVIDPLIANSGTVADKLYDTAMNMINSNKVRVNADRVEAYIKDNKLDKMSSLLNKKHFKHIEKINRFVKCLTQKTMSSEAV